MSKILPAYAVGQALSLKKYHTPVKKFENGLNGCFSMF
jgi:hypothetical protein